MEILQLTMKVKVQMIVLTENLLVILLILRYKATVRKALNVIIVISVLNTERALRYTLEGFTN